MLPLSVELLWTKPRAAMFLGYMICVLCILLTNVLFKNPSTVCMCHRIGMHMQRELSSLGKHWTFCKLSVASSLLGQRTVQPW